jgi:integrase
MKFVQPIRDENKIDEMKLILKKQNYRNYFLFILGINTGLRIGDLLKLKVSDVRDKTHLSIKEQKTEKFKRFPINDSLRKEIAEYTFKMSDETFLFEGRKGKPLGRIMAWKILSDTAKEVGLEEIGTHTLRKTFGYHFYQRKKDVAILQNIFNHSSPSETLQYIGISQDEIDESIRNFSL